LAQPNYQYEKRQRDLAKKKKQEEKRLKKQQNNPDPAAGPDAPAQPPAAE
jgi:hypothetical protein